MCLLGIRPRLTSSLLAFAALSLTGGSALAGDCVGVKLKFVNQTGQTILVKGATIKGNKGTWTENTANQRISNNASHLTWPRRLNKLDSGAVGDFTINYNVDPGINKRVKVTSQTFTGIRCTDNSTLTFNLTNN